MPFAPSIRDDALDDLVEDPKRAVSPFMMVSATTTAAGRRALAAAIHRADGTARPQRVTARANPRYHALLGHMRDLTGVAAVLNTSFNLTASRSCAARPTPWPRSGLRACGGSSSSAFF
jgi:carbamoyltransferase